ncbi:hypothetical protein ABC347_07765 [Sphingomonas sp. 1P06PA]|uniref:hypothetical protein n=1 Tax=Sphingomonas sp. 1P06PA TaxID=554121 RepID=UPI0039A57BE4
MNSATAHPPSQAWNIWGSLLILAGLGLVGYAFLMPVGVTSGSIYGPSEVINIGKIADRDLAFGGGALCLLLGLICWGISEIAERLHRVSLAIYHGQAANRASAEPMPASPPATDQTTGRQQPDA